jgi:hypothetical protein
MSFHRLVTRTLSKHETCCVAVRLHTSSMIAHNLRPRGNMRPPTDVRPPPVPALAITDSPPLSHPLAPVTPNVDDALALVSGDDAQPVTPPGPLLIVACSTTDSLPCDAPSDVDQDNPGTTTQRPPDQACSQPSSGDGDPRAHQLPVDHVDGGPAIADCCRHDHIIPQGPTLLPNSMLPNDGASRDAPHRYEHCALSLTDAPSTSDAIPAPPPPKEPTSTHGHAATDIVGFCRSHQIGILRSSENTCFLPICWLFLFLLLFFTFKASIVTVPSLNQCLLPDKEYASGRHPLRYCISVPPYYISFVLSRD